MGYLIVSVTFRVLYNCNTVGFLTAPFLKKMSKSCFQHKEMWMAKRRNIFAFHFWLNLAMEDVFLAHLLGLSAERIVKPGTCSRPSGACAKWNGREERGQTSRLPRGILAASCSFKYCMATAKEMATCNIIICTPTWFQVCYNLHNVMFAISLTQVIWLTTHNWHIILFIIILFFLAVGVVCRGSLQGSLWTDL